MATSDDPARDYEIVAELLDNTAALREDTAVHRENTGASQENTAAVSVLANATAEGCLPAQTNWGPPMVGSVEASTVKKWTKAVLKVVWNWAMGRLVSLGELEWTKGLKGAGERVWG